MNFGSPRVGNQEFVQYFASRITKAFRVVNFRDIVPHLPTETMNFRHIGTEVWMLANGSVSQFKVCPEEE